jgi:hypothetical protein
LVLKRFPVDKYKGILHGFSFAGNDHFRYRFSHGNKIRGNGGDAIGDDAF